MSNLFKVSWIVFKSDESNPINFWELFVNILRLSSGPPFGKLTASYFPTLAPEGAQTLPRNLLSDVTSTSIVLLPLLLNKTRPSIEVILDNLI